MPEGLEDLANDFLCRQRSLRRNNLASEINNPLADSGVPPLQGRFRGNRRTSPAQCHHLSNEARSHLAAPPPRLPPPPNPSPLTFFPPVYSPPRLSTEGRRSERKALKMRMKNHHFAKHRRPLMRRAPAPVSPSSPLTAYRAPRTFHRQRRSTRASNLRRHKLYFSGGSRRPI